MIFEAAEKKSPFVTEILMEAARYLAVGLINIVNSFDPEVIFLGEDLLKVYSVVGDYLNKSVNSYAFPFIKGSIQILPGSIEEDVSYGLIVQGVSQFIQDPNPLDLYSSK